jgi:hypothetical protein
MQQNTKNINFRLLNNSASYAWFPNNIALFRKAIYSFILIFTCLQFPYLSNLYGPNSLLPIHFYDGNKGLQLLNLLSHEKFAPYYLFFVGGLLTSCLLAFFVKQQQVLALLVYFFYANLYHRSIAIQNGGGDLLTIQLLYLIFMNENTEEIASKNRRIVATALSNFAFTAARLQVILVYLVSAIYKLKGTHWMSGDALQLVFLSSTYGVNFLKPTLLTFPVVFKIITWCVLLFQLLFPILVWIRKAKAGLFIFGISMHLGIIFMMRIPDFGLLMICMYLLFCTDEWCNTQRKRFKFY